MKVGDLKVLKTFLNRYGMVLETIYTNPTTKKHVKEYRIINEGYKYIEECKTNLIDYMHIKLP